MAQKVGRAEVIAKQRRELGDEADTIEETLEALGEEERDLDPKIWEYEGDLPQPMVLGSRKDLSPLGEVHRSVHNLLQQM